MMINFKMRFTARKRVDINSVIDNAIFISDTELISKQVLPRGWLTNTVRLELRGTEEQLLSFSRSMDRQL